MGAISLKLPEDVPETSRRCCEYPPSVQGRIYPPSDRAYESTDAGVTPGKTLGRGLEESAQRKHARQP